MKLNLSSLFAFGKVVSINALVLLILVMVAEYAAGKFLYLYASAKSVTGKGHYTSTYKNDPGLLELRNDLDAYATQSGGAWSYFPATVYITKPFSSKHVNIDDQGIRRTAFGISDPSNKCDEIWIFGSSAVFGDANSDETTVASQLQRVINEVPREKCINVVNFGVHGFMSFQDVYRLRFELTRRPPPKAVFFLHGANDFLKAVHRNKKSLFGRSDIESFDTYIIEAKQIQLAFDSIPSKQFVNWNSLFDYFQNILYITRRIGEKINHRILAYDHEKMKADYIGRRDYHQFWYKKFHEANYKVLESNLGMLKGLSEAFGFRVFVTLQPVIFDWVFNSKDTTVALSDDELSSMQEIPQQRFYPEVFVDLGYAKQTYRDWEENYAAAAKRRGITYVSLSEAMTSDPEGNFANGVHYTANGSLFVARKLLAAISKNLLSAQ